MSHVVKCKHLSLSPLHIYYKINTDFEQLFLYIHFCHYLNSCVYTLNTNSGSIQIKLLLEEKQIKPTKTWQASTHRVLCSALAQKGLRSAEPPPPQELPRNCLQDKTEPNHKCTLGFFVISTITIDILITKSNRNTVNVKCRLVLRHQHSQWY